LFAENSGKGSALRWLIPWEGYLAADAASLRSTSVLAEVGARALKRILCLFLIPS